MLISLEGREQAVTGQPNPAGTFAAGAFVGKLALEDTFRDFISYDLDAYNDATPNDIENRNKDIFKKIGKEYISKMKKILHS